MNIESKDVVKRLETLGYTLNDIDNGLLKLVINGVEQYIKNFCNIFDIPTELYFVAVDMAAGTLLRTKSSVGENVCDNIDFESDEIKSISEGDVSVTYNSNSSSSATAKYNALLDKLCNRDNELIVFRKLRW